MKTGVVVDRARGKPWLGRDGRPISAESGLRLLVLTDRWGPHYEGLGGGADVILLPDLSEKELRAAIVSRLDPDSVVGLSTTSELFLEVIAGLREELGIPGHGTEYTKRVRDKWAMKRLAVGGGVDCPQGVLASDSEGVRELLSACGSVVLKPRTQSGSRGVVVMGKHDEYNRWWEAHRSHAAGFIIEEYLPWQMVHFDGWVAEGAMAWQMSRYIRRTHECGGRVPLSSVTVDDEASVERGERFLRHILSLWELESDVFHIEAFNSPEGLILCEVAARPGGAGVSDVFSQTRGFDLRHSKTRLDLGLPLTELSSWRRDRKTQGGWVVFYCPFGECDGIDTRGLNAHYSSDIRQRNEATVRNFAGVGLATFTFVADSSAEVVETIGAYEDGIQALPVVHRVD